MNSRTGHDLEWGAGNLADIPAATRVNGRYLSFLLGVNPAIVFPQTTMQRRQMRVYIQLPINANGRMEGVYH